MVRESGNVNISKESPEMKLAKHDHIKEIIPPTKEALALAEKLKDLREVIKGISVNSFIDYLEAPLIIDDFDPVDDIPRNEFEKSLTSMEAGLYSKNKLRGNVVGSPAPILQLLHNYKKLSQKEEEIYNKYSEPYSRYKELPLKDKLEVIKNIDEIIKEIGGRVIEMEQKKEAA